MREIPYVFEFEDSAESRRRQAWRAGAFASAGHVRAAGHDVPVVDDRSDHIVPLDIAQSLTYRVLDFGPWKILCHPVQAASALHSRIGGIGKLVAVGQQCQ